MSEIIRTQLEAGRRCLMIELVTGTAVLTDGSEPIRRPGGRGWMQFACIDIADCFAMFEAKALPREAFTLSEISAMCETEATTVTSWVRGGILKASIRQRDGTRGKAMLFDRTDAFAACLVATFRRKYGLPLRMLGEISDVLREVEPRKSQVKSKHRSAKRPRRKERAT